ncbi:MAG TPA: hypothetical protein DDX29_06325, partial [Clostridiales bacterium]|nr:hypothetical protein [Clostridiales bacterium]
RFSKSPLLLITYTFANVAGLMIIAHASPIGQQVANLTALEAGSIVSILAIVNTIGRLFWGTVSDKLGRMRVVFIMYVIKCYHHVQFEFIGHFLIICTGSSIDCFLFWRCDGDIFFNRRRFLWA